MSFQLFYESELRSLDKLKLIRQNRRRFGCGVSFSLPSRATAGDSPALALSLRCFFSRAFRTTQYTRQIEYRMPLKQPIRLGPTQETLLVPLFARAEESRRKRPILQDARAAEIVESIDWDFQRFNQRTRILACALRAAMFDQWVSQFLREHPAGTVIEIGAGLNTRFQRLDNGSVHWFDLDLPDVIEVRRKFLRDGERHTMLPASVLNAGWLEMVGRSPGPYFFVAETVFIYLQEAEVKAALAQIAKNFPRAGVALDTGSARAVVGGNKDFVRRKMAARFAWACEDPRSIESWNICLRLLESRALAEVAGPLRARLSLPVRASFRAFGALFPKLTRAYLLNLFEVVPPL